MADRPEAWDAAQSVPTSLELATMNNFVKTGYDLSRLKECALKAGVAENSVGRVSANAIKKLGNNPLMQKALKKAGVDFERLASKINDLLEAEHPAYEGKPDNQVQQKALDTALKIFDAMPNPKLEIESRHESIHINITADLVRGIESVTGMKVIDVEPELPKGNFEEGPSE